jgi:catechol 2,3-dioxygenase-like lactoylglutathione lyase family enzyme
MSTRWLSMGPGQEMHLVFKEDFEVSAHEQEFGRHFALSCPLGEFAALKERLVAHGAELVAPGRDTPFERFFFRSPDGYVFEIIEAEKFKDEIDQLFEENNES